MNSEAVVQPRSNGSALIRVLMADPDESLHPVYREPLSGEGFDVVAAFSGLECVARLASAYRTCLCWSRSCRGAEATEFSR